ncbi:MAG: hypothetical protein M3N46_03845 [Actinomycetota bacterium]|nr:hypothetical protein [Actinomycetota bacterium]
MNDDSGPDSGAAGIGGSGFGLDELAAYHDRGRTPAIADIDDNAECQAVLDSLKRLGELSRALIERDAIDLAVDDSWLAGILGAIAFEVRAGNDIEFPDVDAGTRLTITEGAVREIVRWAGDSVPDVLVGRVGLLGDTADPAAEISVEVTISAGFPAPVGDRADAVRVAVAGALMAHTPLSVTRIDVTVGEIHLPGSGGGAA